jgi:hypothetical protein
MSAFSTRRLQALTLCAAAALASGAAGAQSLTTDEARQIARDAYVYGFPIVDSYRVMHSYFVDRGGKAFKAPWNQIHNEARVYTPDDRTIQTPNSDTPYSQLGTDLRAEPLVITVPAVDPKRYYSLQFIDAYTFNYAYVGSRATGSGVGSYLLAGPGWQGDKPAGIKAVIRSETNLGWVLYRTQLFDAGDIDAVKKVQAGFKVQPLSAFLGKPAPAPAPRLDFIQPLSVEQQRSSPEFFEVLNFNLGLSPVHPSEQTLMARFGRLGIGPNGSFKAASLTPELRAAVEAGMADAWKQFEGFKKADLDTGKRTAAEGFGTREFLKNDYLVRMASAVLGIYGNSKEEALYPAYYTDTSGAKLDGGKQYTLRFAPGQLPPVNAFWSLTMYELPASLLVPNPLKRYLINSPMLPSLKEDADGGVTLYLQHESPGKDRESNWLPAPKGPFWTVMRLYWPKSEALDGRWKTPALQSIAARTTAGAASAGSAAGPVVAVTAENFARAESDLYLGATVKRGGFAKFDHNRAPTPIDRQEVIRMNRDTLYSAAVFDLDTGPASITLPDAGQRFLSMQVINQDHYTPMVVYGGGKHVLTRDGIGTRYVMAAVRILADPNDAQDLATVHQLQDAIKAEQSAPGRFEVPPWDPASHQRVRDALNVLADTLPDKNRMFGAKGQVDPVRHLLGSASAWGGNPDKEAIYLSVTPDHNDGRTPYRLTVKDVPVDAFWSVSVYNAEGYFEKNAREAYSLNNLTAQRGADGAVTLQFGDCDGSVTNCLPITPGWNYMVRLYRPQQPVLNGSWRFPVAQPLK